MTNANVKEKANAPTLQALFTEEEYGIVVEKAKNYGQSVSNYFRMVALHTSPTVIVQQKAGTRKKLIQARVTPEQLIEAETKADSLGMKLPDYLRMVALHVQISFDLSKNINTIYKSKL